MIFPIQFLINYYSKKFSHTHLLILCQTSRLRLLCSAVLMTVCIDGRYMWHTHDLSSSDVGPREIVNNIKFSGKWTLIACYCIKIMPHLQNRASIKGNPSCVMIITVVRRNRLSSVNQSDRLAHRRRRRHQSICV